MMQRLSGLRRLALLLVPVALLPALLGADTADPPSAMVQARPPVLQFPPDGWTTDNLTPTFQWDAEGSVHLWVATADTRTPVANVHLPRGIGSYALSTPLVGGQEYRWRVRTNPFDSTSVFTWSVWSPEYSFKTPGNLPWNLSAYARPLTPANGTLASTMAPTLTWQAPAGATHYQMTITPAGNPAGAVRFVERMSNSYKIPGAPAWFGMLPNTVYHWSVRVNNAPGPVPENHPAWGPWSEVFSFRTPTPPSNLLGPVTPQHQATVTTATPRLQWGDPTPDVFLYEIQISRDPNFVTDPAKSVAPVYWETVHGGMTTPANSYQVSDRYPLLRGQNYFWRVRPSLPASAAEAPWGATWSFHVE